METNIKDLIQAADNLCESLDRCIQNEKQFSINALIALDQMANDSRKIALNLMEIQYYEQGVI